METGKTDTSSKASAKAGKYFKYAIGEIILVVIGILIALSINNWNNSAELKIRETVVLKEIISDLEANLSHANKALGIHRGVSRDSTQSIYIFMIDHLENKRVNNSNLPRFFDRMHQCPSLSLKTSGFESLKSQGMDLISNDSARSKIGSYYTTYIPNIKAEYTELRDDFYNYMLKFPRTLFKTIIANGYSTGQIPHNYDALLNNNEYIESLKMYLSIYGSNLKSTITFKKSTEKLLEELKLYIENHN